MTPEQTKELLANIVTEINQAGDTLGLFVPQVAAAMVIGKAVDRLIPGLVADVQSWIEGNPPTAQEKADVAAKINELLNPDLP